MNQPPAADHRPLGPLEALRRIAYLLEASNAESHRVRAFRRAAATLDDVGPAKVADLAAAGRLTSLPGVGATTATVVEQALAATTPDYLAELERNVVGPELTGPAAGLRSRLQGDCHSHSDWSDGGSPIEEMAMAARALGHRYLVLTDHSPRLTVAHGLNADRLRQQLAIVAELNERLFPFRILTGIEVDILENGDLDQDLDLLGELDVVVASAHSKLSMEPRAMTARLIAAVESPHTDILGHCTGRKLVGKGRSPSRFDPEAVFAACARTDTAVEINCRPERRDPPQALLALAAAAGCSFSIDTDAHAPGQLEWLGTGCQKAADAELTPERIVNTMGPDELVTWAAGHER